MADTGNTLRAEININITIQMLGSINRVAIGTTETMLTIGFTGLSNSRCTVCCHVIEDAATSKVKCTHMNLVGAGEPSLRVAGFAVCGYAPSCRSRA